MQFTLDKIPSEIFLFTTLKPCMLAVDAKHNIYMPYIYVSCERVNYTSQPQDGCSILSILLIAHAH